MLAQDFVKKDDRNFTPIQSSRSASYFFVLVLTKILRCIGIFFVDILAKSSHIVNLLWLCKIICTCILFPLQKPLSAGKPLKRGLTPIILKLSLLNSVIEVLWFYGITLCGPLRSVLVFELSSTVLLSAIVSFFKGGQASTTAKTRGFFLLIVGFVALFLMDKDGTIEAPHDTTHAHHSGLNHLFYHLIGLFGMADHKGGLCILILSLFLRTAFETTFRHLAVEVGGAKRLHTLVTAGSTICLTPVAVLSWALSSSSIASISFFKYAILLVVVAVFVFVLDFYAESICFQHVADPVMAAARWSSVTMFACAFGLSYMWYGGQNLDDHALTGGVFITVICFILASISLTHSNAPKHRGGQFVGISNTGLPLFTYGEAFLQKTSKSLMRFIKDTLNEILANNDSRRIFWFLCVNLGFCGIEFLYGFWTNSLGLISDGFHMLFDCSALVMGLVASVMARWPPSKHFTFGFGRVEILSGFINALFLCVIALFILIEALERLFDPPNINTDRLLFVAVSGLLVNLFGMYSLGEHGHSHGGSSHGHSHGGGSHGHSHGNANMQGVFLHVLADTLGSVFVIISTLLIQWFGWVWVDPLCSLFLSLLIIGSVYPLLVSSINTLLQDIPEEDEFEYHINEILDIEHVESYSNAHMWQHNDINVASVHVQVADEANAQMVRHRVANILKGVGSAHSTVQVEKKAFGNRIQQLCPNYKMGYTVVRGSVIKDKKPHGHSHGHSHDHGGHHH
uniref:Proton-coupled zinc antiporter SLC30A5 n=1 Tax=Caenorhabditis tropicalis TaxID=1561998 RepID=A0A1I7UT16_9PELO